MHSFALSHRRGPATVITDGRGQQSACAGAPGAPRRSPHVAMVCVVLTRAAALSCCSAVARRWRHSWRESEPRPAVRRTTTLAAAVAAAARWRCIEAL